MEPFKKKSKSNAPPHFIHGKHVKASQKQNPQNEAAAEADKQIFQIDRMNPCLFLDNCLSDVTLNSHPHT